MYRHSSYYQTSCKFCSQKFEAETPEQVIWLLASHEAHVHNSIPGKEEGLDSAGIEVTNPTKEKGRR